MKKFLPFAVGLLFLLTINPLSAKVNLEEIVHGVVVVNTSTGVGTGFIVSPNKIFTAGHVLKDSFDIRVSDTEARVYFAQKTFLFPEIDAAWVETKTKLSNPVKVSCAPRYGESVFIIGHTTLESESGKRPIFIYWLVKHGNIAKIFPDGTLVLDGEISPGMSGSPVFNLSGEVVGMAVSGFNSTAPGLDQLTDVLSSKLLGLCD